MGGKYRGDEYVVSYHLEGSLSLRLLPTVVLPHLLHCQSSQLLCNS